MKVRVLRGVVLPLALVQVAAAQEPGSGAQGASADAAVGFGDSGATASTTAATDDSSEATDTESAKSEGDSDATPPAYAGARANRSPDPYEPSERYASVPYMQRYKPTGNLWEIGLFGGAFFPSADHNLKVPSRPAEEYSDASFLTGARVAYYPLSFLGLEVEGMVSPSKTQSTDRSSLFYSARGQGILQLPLWSIVPFAVVGGGVLGSFSEPMGHDGDPLFHFGVGAKAALSHLVGLRLDLRDNLTQARDEPNGTMTHHFEAQLGVTFTLGRTPPPPPRDRDYDGLFDSEDACPDHGALTADGCPTDRDGDGVFDDADQCPNEAGPAPTGCPVIEVDADGDGIPLPCDACPDEKGQAPDGCPLKDSDGDGILNDVDKCPNEPETRNGFEDDDGCPDEVPEAMKRFTGVMQGIVFEQGKAKIRKESLTTLDAAYDVLVKYPSIRLEVSGHTSSEGTDAVNQKLSEDRAASVRDYLVQKGIAQDRVVARGAGSSEPIADNATREGREQNRRIEFRILAQP